MKNGSKAVVLAAGKGTRLRTEGVDLPKVLRQAAGRPLLGYVLEELSFLKKEDVVLVVGYEREKVLAAYPEYPHAVQEPQQGTGHAVQCAREALAGFDGSVLVCYGDMPLMRRATYVSLIETHKREGNDCTLLSAVSDEELPLLTGTTDCESGTAQLAQNGIRLIFVTLGANGVFYRFGDKTGHVAGVPCKVGDTNGAGDTFFGAALSKLCKEELDTLTVDKLEGVLAFANKAASITTSRHGAIPAMPTLAEVEG